VGWSLLASHGVELPLLALIDALEKHGRPEVLHSDQGVEYKSRSTPALPGASASVCP